MLPTCQNALKIIQQPDKVFHNQQFGKRHGFWISVRTNISSSSENSLKLEAELRYADNLEKPMLMKIPRKKHNKPLLEILDKSNFESGEASMYCRINDVSRNHGKDFRILLKCLDGRQCVQEVYTQPIKVISKEPKTSGARKTSTKKHKCFQKKRKRSTTVVTKRKCSSPKTTPRNKHKRSSPSGTASSASPSATASHPCSAAPKKAESLFHRGFDLLRRIAYDNRVGYFDEERTIPIRQCPMCLGCNNSTEAAPKHVSSCPVVALLEEYEDTITSPQDGVHEPDMCSIDSSNENESGDTGEKHSGDDSGDVNVDLFDMWGVNSRNGGCAPSLDFFSEDESDDTGEKHSGDDSGDANVDPFDISGDNARNGGCAPSLDLFSENESGDAGETHSTDRAANNLSNNINSPDSIVVDHSSAIEERDIKLLIEVFGDEDFDMSGSMNAYSLDVLGENELKSE